MDGRLTITDVARTVGVTPRTIMRWEKSGKIRKPKRDWRGWRIYYKEDLAVIKQFFETTYEFNEEEGTMVNITKGVIAVLLFSLALGSGYGGACAEAGLAQAGAVQESEAAVDINLGSLPVVKPNVTIAEDVKYTLGPNDVIEIEVRRHPEFGGQYSINSEGKIEYKFVGDIIVTGLTKAELKERLSGILAEYILEPEIDVCIVGYLSKVFYVVGDVGQPGKFYMRGNTITVREALIQSGLPTGAAAMRKCRLITPSEAGQGNYNYVDAYKLLYEGNLTENLQMQPGDVFYVPATVMAKIIRVISPVTNVVGQTTSVAATGAAF